MPSAVTSDAGQTIREPAAKPLGFGLFWRSREKGLERWEGKVLADVGGERV